MTQLFILIMLGMGKRSVSTIMVGLIITSIFSFSTPVQAPSATVFSTDFNAGVPAQFSGVTTTESVQGYAGLGTGSNVFGGNFLRNTSVPPQATTLTLTGLPSHTSISVGFLLAIIDSWDGNGCFAGPDTFNVTVDGVVVFSHVFENSTCGIQTYVPPAGVELARRQSLGFTPAGTFFADSAYDMGLDPIFQNIPHTSSTLTIEWFAGGSGWQGGSDESWAIDNVEVMLQGVPEPLCVTPPSGLVSWWPGDTDASDIQDGNGGALINGAFAGVPGMVDGAFSFDGTDDYVRIENSPTLDLATGNTIDFWIKVDTLPESGKFSFLINKWVSGAEDKQIALLPDGRIYYFLFNTFGGSVLLSNTALTTGQWYHIAATYDGSTAKIYINGQLDSSKAASGNVGDSSGRLFFGYNPDRVALESLQTVVDFLDGQMDEIEWYDRALSASEVQSLFEAGSAGKCKVPADTTPPAITCPEAQTTEATGSLTTVSIGTPAVSDNVDPSPTVTSDIPPGFLFPMGTTTITFRATDDAGNESSCTTTVTVVDTTPPTITAPSPVTADTDPGACFATVVPIATATDLVDTNPTVTGARSDGQALTDAYPKGTTTITWTVTDSSGNTASKTQIVTVMDDEPPRITAPPDIIVTANTAGGYTGPIGSATATDNCLEVIISNDAPSIFPAGTTIVTWTAEDTSDNIATATQTVNVGLLANIDIDPNTINLKSEGKYVTGFISGIDFRPADIDPSTVALRVMGIDKEISAVSGTWTLRIGDGNGDGVPDRTFKFDRQEVIASIPTPGTYEVIVTGKLFSGTIFEGTDMITAI